MFPSWYLPSGRLLERVLSWLVACFVVVLLVSYSKVLCQSENNSVLRWTGGDVLILSKNIHRQTVNV